MDGLSTIVTVITAGASFSTLAALLWKGGALVNRLDAVVERFERFEADVRENQRVYDQRHLAVAVRIERIETKVDALSCAPSNGAGA